MTVCECIKGSIHEGQPKGKEELIHGLNTYVVGNRTNPRGIIVIYSDIFGLPLPNNKLIADSYAESGEFLVYLPDFFKGDPVKLKIADVLIPVDASKQSSLSKYTGMLASLPTFIGWFSRHKEGSTHKDCMDFMEALRRATPSTQKIGMAGFCWGGRYAIRAGLEKNMIEINSKRVPLVDAVVALHPSNLSLPEDADAPVVPISIGWGEQDKEVNLANKDKIETFHAQLVKQGKTVPEIVHQVYKPGRHGFAVRGNPDNPAEKACLEDSVKQAMGWFEKYL